MSIEDGLDAVAVDLRQGEFADVARGVGALRGPIAEAGSDAERHGVDAERLQHVRRVRGTCRLPVDDGNTAPLPWASCRRASSSTPSARSDSGTRWSQPAFMRAAGTVHTAASRSISRQSAFCLGTSQNSRVG